MKRAVELFTFERRSPPSPMIEQTWQTRSEPEESFISVAVSHWEMVVTRQWGTARLTVRGPETKATTLPIPKDAEFFGIQFSLGTFMPGLPPGQLVDSSLTLPRATKTSFWLDGSGWELPGPGNADVFVDRLVRAGLPRAAIEMTHPDSMATVSRRSGRPGARVCSRRAPFRIWTFCAPTRRAEPVK
jgi:hypothetical protein